MHTARPPIAMSIFELLKAGPGPSSSHTIAPMRAGADKAYNASLIACNENPAAHKVSYDDALAAMAEISRDMSCKYKETSTGGLAVCLVVC